MADNLIENALYIVSTPIGNLQDITLRALSVLDGVDIIACEDTRTTSVLLERHNILSNLISYHKFSNEAKTDEILNFLKEGKSVALVTDAGTPLISDPGNVLVKKAIDEGIKIVPVAGACALIALLSSTDRIGEDFKFIGFISKSESKIVETINNNKFENLIFYESPNRILQTLETISNNFPLKTVTVGRELTKKFEEIKKGNVKDILNYFKNNVSKGEFVVLIHKDEKTQKLDFEEKIKKLLKLNLKDKQIASILAELFNANKNDVYQKCLEIKKEL